MMEVTYNCFTENTEEIREYLKKIGFDMKHCTKIGEWISVSKSGEARIFIPATEEIRQSALKSERIVNCLGKPDLFKMLATSNYNNKIHNIK